MLGHLLSRIGERWGRRGRWLPGPAVEPASVVPMTEETEKRFCCRVPAKQK